MTSERAAGGSLDHRNYETKPDLLARSGASMVWLSGIKPNFRRKDPKCGEKSPAIPEIRRHTPRSDPTTCRFREKQNLQIKANLLK